VCSSDLIPRPDTETLVEQVLHAEDEGALRFADVGTGSGIVAAILTEQRPAWAAVASDISLQALAVAAANRRSGRVALVCCDLLDAVAGGRRFDFIVSNPPYISTGDIGGLDESVRNFEPRRALDGGADGLDFYRRFARELPRFLVPGGRLYCEIGCDQAQAVAGIFAPDAGWNGLQLFRDLAGRWRVMRAAFTGKIDDE
jgi:release factor glutamine methyltransferase